MTTLFVVRSSPYSTREMKTTLELAKPGDAIMILQDAVFTFRSPSDDRMVEDALARGLKIYALKADLEARSVRPPPGVQTVGYDELVELITGHERTVS